MINKRYILFSLALIFATVFSVAWSQVDSALYVELTNTKPCVKVQESKLITFEGTDSTLSPFFKKLDDVLNNGRSEVNIWHVGGSHVQAGVFSHRVRNNIAKLINGGQASRTIMFPYKLIGTNGPADYKVSGTGTWTKSKCTERNPTYELGLSGITAVTSSPDASVTFAMSTGGDVDWSASVIKVIGKASDPDVLPYIVVGNKSLKCRRCGDNDIYEFDVPDSTIAFTVMFHGLGAGKSFELRGVVAMNNRPGVNYWASGVNGAATSSWLKCSLLEQDLKLIAPDMVVFGIGINDAHTPNFKPEKFKANYQQIIDKIKRTNPLCHFMFVTNNDNLMKSGVNPNTERVEKVFMELAQENNGSVWNLYRVMGGFGGSKKWVGNSLMQKDHIHFTRAGYQLIGDMFYNALVQEYLNWKY